MRVRRIRYCALLSIATGVAFMGYLNALFMVAGPAALEFPPLQTSLSFLLSTTEAFQCLSAYGTKREREREHISPS
jgi:hypothetical protein